MPIPSEAFARLTNAFRETGRGLIVAGGGTALVQGAVATVAYVAIGIPRALLLGPLTALCAIVPLVGTGLVWVPLAIELGATGQYWRAGVVVAVGAGVHSLIDNFIRPLFARYGRLTLPTFVVFVSMIGGVAVFGAAGALLGPLVVRLCAESLAIVFEMRRGAAQVPAETPSVRDGDRAGSEPVDPSSIPASREAGSSL
jgi:predicted PurR-regulated permease PerM